MKAIVVYFSLEGNTKYVADKIAEFTGADELRLEPAKDYPRGNVSKFFWGGKSVVFGESPKLLPYDFDVEKYDLVIIGTPVWAGSFTPPIKTFIKENDLSKKKVALFACSAGGVGKCLDKLKDALPACEVIATFDLISPKKTQSEETVQKIKSFCDGI
jgi:flavodoxin